MSRTGPSGIAASEMMFELPVEDEPTALRRMLESSGHRRSPMVSGDIVGWGGSRLSRQTRAEAGGTLNAV